MTLSARSLRTAIALASLFLLASAAQGQTRLEYHIYRQPAAARTPAEPPFVMAVEQVYRTRKDTIVTGRIESGTVRINDDLELVGLGYPLRLHVDGIDRFGRHVGQAGPGQSVGIRFYRTERGAVMAGQVLATRGTIQSCVTFEALVAPLPLGRGGTADFRFRGSKIDGSIIFTGPPVPEGGAVPARVRLTSGFAMNPGLRFAIGRKGRYFGSGIVGQCLLGLGINDDKGDDHLAGLVDDFVTINHGTSTMTELIAWILAHRMGIDPALIRPEARIVEDLKSSRNSVVRAIEEEMFIDIEDEAAERIVTVADAVRAARRAIPQLAR